MKKLIAESLNDYNKEVDLDDNEDVAVNSPDEDWFKSEEIEDIDDKELEDLDKDLNDLPEISDEETELDPAEDINTNRNLLKHIKTIIDINKGKPDKEKNYITFKVKGKLGDVVEGIPFDIKGNKDNASVSFIRKGTKSVKLVELSNIILEKVNYTSDKKLNESVSKETLFRIEGAIDMKFERDFISSANKIIADLDYQGFEKDDIKEYLCLELKKL